MADPLAAILGLQQQNAQQTNPFLNPNTATNDLDAAIQQGQRQQQLNLSKGYLDLAGSAQAFDQDYKTKQLAIATKEFQNKQRISDLLFPLQQKETQLSLDNWDKTAGHIDSALDQQAFLDNQAKQTQINYPLATQEIANLSDEQIANGEYANVIAKYAGKLTPAAQDQLTKLAQQKQQTSQYQNFQYQQFQDSLYQKQLETYQQQRAAITNMFQNDPRYSTPEAKQEAENNYLERTGLAFPPTPQAAYINPKTGARRGYFPPRGSQGGAVNPNATTADERGNKQAIDKLVQQRTNLANQKNDLIKKNGAGIDTSGIDDQINKINKQIQSINPKAAFFEDTTTAPTISPAQIINPNAPVPTTPAPVPTTPAPAGNYLRPSFLFQ